MTTPEATDGLHERLRKHMGDCFGCQQRGVCEEAEALFQEAADALATKDAELAELKSQRDEMDRAYEHLAALAAERDRLREMTHPARPDLQTELATLKAERDELKEQLKE